MNLHAHLHQLETELLGEMPDATRFSPLILCS